MGLSTIREDFFNLVDLPDDGHKQTRFIEMCKSYLKSNNEIQLPMQLFERIFSFDSHREVVHPISSNIVQKFRNDGLKVGKVRNKHLVRIRNL